jgi:hypothetical protein
VENIIGIESQETRLKLAKSFYFFKIASQQQVTHSTKGATRLCLRQVSSSSSSSLLLKKMYNMRRVRREENKKKKEAKVDFFYSTREIFKLLKKQIKFQYCYCVSFRYILLLKAAQNIEEEKKKGEERKKSCSSI